METIPTETENNWRSSRETTEPEIKQDENLETHPEKRKNYHAK